MKVSIYHSRDAATLRARHGRSRPVVATRGALRLIGKRAEVHPRDVVAFAYRDQAAADAYTAANLERYGHPSLGMAVFGDEVIGVLDLRPGLASQGIGLISPLRPDDWRRPHYCGGNASRCGRCLDTGQVCEQHPYITQENCGDAGCGAAGMPCPACCSPVPADRTPGSNRS